MERIIPWLCLVLTLTTPNAAWALAMGDCAAESDRVDREVMNHSAMDHSAHQGTPESNDASASATDCPCCADSCSAHCIGGIAFVRVAALRADGAVPGTMTEARYGASYFPSPPVSALYRPPIVS